MKSILISIKPEWVRKILSGEKTIEVRKTAPKCELPATVYIYCTKQGKRGDLFFGKKRGFYTKPLYDDDEAYEYAIGLKPLNGKVVAKFTLNKIENFVNGMNELEREWDGKPDAEYDYFAYEKALEKACLTYDEADGYCPDQSFYAWHISDLVIFDKPKELDEFDYLNPSGTRYVSKRSINGLPSKKHPPRSWCYVEERK